jgi:hypothetical protein
VVARFSGRRLELAIDFRQVGATTFFQRGGLIPCHNQTDLTPQE